MSKPMFKMKKCGPLQIVHDFRFTALNVKDDYSFLDKSSHEEKLAHMKMRVDSLCNPIVGGVFNQVYYNKIMNYVRLKYHKRY